VGFFAQRRLEPTKVAQEILRLMVRTFGGRVNLLRVWLTILGSKVLETLATNITKSVELRWVELKLSKDASLFIINFKNAWAVNLRITF